MRIRTGVFIACAGMSLILGAASGRLSAEPASGSTVLPKGLEVESGQRFIHTVLFWLKKGTSEAKKEALIRDCRELLGAISTVEYLAVGEPAGTPREVVDNSFDVGLVVHFTDAAGHDAYQAAEKHLQFIERNQTIWERVQVYDITIP